MKKLIAYLELARPLNGSIAFISATLGAVFASHGTVKNILDVRVLYVSVSAFLLLSAGNAINDYCDHKIDSINRPQRPIPSGRVQRREALIFAGVLICVGIWLGTLINRTATGIALLVSLTLVSYAFRLKRTLLIGNLVVSGLTAITFISGGVALNSVSGTFVPAIFAFLFTAGREIVKDLEDIAGDRAHNVRTLATWHPRRAVWTAIGFMGAVVLFSPLPYLLGWYSWHYLLIVIIGVDLLLIFAAIRLYRDASRERCAAIQRWMKWDIFIGLAAIYLGTFL